MNNGMNTRIIVPTLLAKKGYIGRTIATAPILYYPMNESSGSAAVNYGTLGTGANGAYTGVDLANALGPDGRNSAPYFDGTNDYLDAYTVAFRDAFSGLEGTAAAWFKVENAAVWTDGITRRILHMGADGPNIFAIRRSTSNKMYWYYSAAGTAVALDQGDYSTTDWAHIAMTWSRSGNIVRRYYNGAEVGAGGAGVNLWAGTIAAHICTIGARKEGVLEQVWKGWLAHALIYARVLTPTEIAALVVV